MNTNTLIVYLVVFIIGAGAGYFVKSSPQEKGATSGSKTVSGTAMPSHPSEPYELSASDPKPTVAVQPLLDSKAGWNLHIVTTDFTFDPANVGGDSEVGTGHAHVFVDGVKVGRAYSDWYYLSALAPGKHTITVELVTNNHRDYQINGVKVGASGDVTQPIAGMSGADSKKFDLVVKDKKIVSGNGDISVMQGDTVSITVTNDADEELHVHGYDATVELKAGVPATVTFLAGATGRFPFELEGSKTDIGAVSVMPR